VVQCLRGKGSTVLALSRTVCGCRESCDAQSADWRSEYFRSVSTRAWEAVHKVAQVDVGGLAEGIAFSPDGGYLYVGNFVDGDVDILRVDGDTLTKAGSFSLPGHPASLRGSTP
jgi:hypothetical protein